MTFKVEKDSTSLASGSWANTGKPLADAVIYDVPQADGTSRRLYLTPYQFGLCLEYDGLVECWTSGWSFHNNFRTQGGQPPEVWFGDPLDSGGLMLQGQQVFHVVNGQPVVDKEWGQITCQKFGKGSHGDLRMLVRGATDGFEFRGGSDELQTLYARIDQCGVHVAGTNLYHKLQELETRIEKLEAKA